MCADPVKFAVKLTAKYLLSVVFSFVFPTAHVAEMGSTLTELYLFLTDLVEIGVFADYVKADGRA